MTEIDKEREQKKKSLYRRLTKLLQSTPIIKSKALNVDFTFKLRGTASEIFKTVNAQYTTQLAAYSNYDRFARYTDYAEMDGTPEVFTALNIFADESTLQDEQGLILDINSENEEVVLHLESLFYDTLNINFYLWHWCRNLCKFGDFFLLVDLNDEIGIMNLITIPINEVIREEGYDPNSPLAVKFRWITKANIELPNWQVIHFRLLGNDSFLPYGTSTLEGARRIWRQLLLMEDAMMVYRIVRSPERRVFYIEVGNAEPHEVPVVMEKQKQELAMNAVSDQDGHVDMRFKPMDMATDYYVPKRGELSSRIESLPGGQFTGDIDDVEYLQKKLISALGVPRAYLGFEEALAGKATLCIDLETKIPLLDGRALTLQEIINEYNNNKENFNLWSYSVDPKTLNIVSGKISWAGITKKNAQVVEVEIDDGSKVICTPDHKFMLRDGSYKEAQFLQLNDSLMPLYIKEYFSKNIGYANHKVVSIKFLEEKRDTGCITVEKYHNFAIANDEDKPLVFIKNSQEDVRFSRTIQRIQKVLVSELTKIALIHLYTIGFKGEDLIDFELSLTNPSNLAEMQKLELWRSKLEVARDAPDAGLSEEWIQEQLFGFSEEEVYEMKKQRMRDKDFQWKLSQIESNGLTTYLKEWKKKKEGKPEESEEEEKPTMKATKEEGLEEIEDDDNEFEILNKDYEKATPAGEENLYKHISFRPEEEMEDLAGINIARNKFPRYYEQKEGRAKKLIVEIEENKGKLITEILSVDNEDIENKA